MTPARTLEERVIDYRDALRSMASQIEDLGAMTGKGEAIEDAVRLYRLIADDLAKLIDGEELKTWTITGTLP